MLAEYICDYLHNSGKVCVLGLKAAGITISVKNAFLVLIVANLLDPPVGDVICIDDDYI